MKWMIASDIHGSAYYCRKLLERFDAEGADRMLLLGDLLYHGPRNELPEEYETKSVTAQLNERKHLICAVRGNCDAEVDQMVLEFPITADFINLMVDGRRFFLTHGHRYNPIEPPLDLAPGDVMLSGHTHVPASFRSPEGVWFLNPGSVSIPKNRSPHSYMTYENGLFLWKTLGGEIYRELSLEED